MGKGQAVAGFVLSIIGIVFGIFSGWLSIIGLPVAIVGLVLAIIGRKKLKANELPTGLATAAFILGIIAVVFTAIAFFTCGVCIICATSTVGGIGSVFDSVFS